MKLVCHCLSSHGARGATFEKERLDGEVKIIVEYGLKNKREVWHAQYALAKIRTAERHLLTLDENGKTVSSKVMRCSAA